MISYVDVISPECLFFGHHSLKPIISPDIEEELLNHELHEWISSIYWGEQLGIEYSLKMFEISPSHDLKEFWWNTYKEEIDHQKRLAEWLLEKKTAPLPPTLMIRRIKGILDKNKKAKNYYEYKEVISKGQIFLEETGAVIIKWRTNFIKDRSLKAILYKIYRDEMSHISQGKKILLEMEQDLKTRKQLFLDCFLSLFPMHLAKKHLDLETYEILKERIKSNFSHIAEECLNSSVYRPQTPIVLFEEVPEYECFGCKPTRSEGLLLEPKRKSDIEVYDEISFNSRFTGMNGLVHGGFISMALDEMMGYAITINHGKFSLTTDLRLNFKSPVKCNSKYLIQARIDNVLDQQVKCSGEIIEISNNKICATSEATFYLLNKSLCSKLFPGILANSKTSEMLYV